MFSIVAPYILAWLAFTVGMLWFYQRQRRDLPIMAMVLFWVIWVALRVVGELLLDDMGHTRKPLLLTLMLIAPPARPTRWLRGLETVPVSTPETADPQLQKAEKHTEVLSAQEGDASQPWYIQGLLAFGAWLATFLLLTFVFPPNL
jgi:hypothetical protein